MGLSERDMNMIAWLANDAEGFGVVLCTDPAIMAQYLEQLQQIDRHAQTLRELAEIMRANRPEAAIGAVRLGALRSELEEAIAA
ncbi:MAG: hypothetical protein HC869_26265 [Rhodospirillales bacterium]|nr:hypothetical protein [Rhodospirillales bacterium]